ncbi:MAG: RNA methyltransferase [Opitutaceae bacterium]|jgi:TrmH RNA methyltransferase|nr:RNA methyltransferase [Opitutaceae bacterium]
MASADLKLCGLPAVKARFRRDAASFRRLYFDYATGRKLGLVCKALAAAKKVYRCVEPAELAKIAGSIHHGGVVAVVAETPLRAPLPRDVLAWAKARAPLLLLDRIGNAHNVGAIARSAAFFGVEHLVIPSRAEAALPGVAAHRVAEGGLEHVTIWRVPDLARLCGELRVAGYEVIGAAARGGALRPGEARPARGAVRGSDARLPDAGSGSRGGRPLRALVLGNEEHGLAPEVAAACSRLVTIPGSGRVESLNVSAAAAVLMFALLG